MKIKMNILENAYGFLNTSVEFFKKADQYGNHNEYFQTDSTNNDWKMAIINIIQAMELIFKECLNREHKVFIYEDIDNFKASGAKTVSISQAFNRIINILNFEISDSDKKLIENVIKLRNEIMHFEFEITSEEAKAKYGTIFKFLSKFHEKYICTDIKTTIKTELHTTVENLVYFMESLVPFRGSEVHRKELNEIKAEILESQEKLYYLIDGVRYQRIKYGDEPSIKNTEYCGDCLAKKGEFHVPGCDIEVCPKCFGQAITCKCNYEGEDND